MIVINKKIYIHKLFADKLSHWDLFRAVCYFSYRGDINSIPFYYHIIRGWTAVSDLTKSTDDLLMEMKSNTRNEIKRAMREGCSFEVGHDFESFIPYYNSFCKSKGLDDRVYLERLNRYSGDNEVWISKAIHNDTVLAMHATVVNKNEKIAYLIMSCSHRLDANVDRKLTGWANRYLHYKDLEFLKELGIAVYDWSGICMDPNDERYSIGQFKLSFGGKCMPSYVLSTPLYRIMEKIRSLVIRIK